MNRLTLLTIIWIIAACCLATAEKVETFDQAKALSLQTGKPILIEFTRSGCDYCDKAARDKQSNQMIKQAFGSVVHFILNAREDEGLILSRKYYIGVYFPLFILTDNQGNVITRWNGYISASRFLNDLRTALSDLTTINARVDRNLQNSNLDDSKYLAQYYSDSHEYTSAIEMYKQAENLDTRGVLDFSYEIFSSTANLAWNDSVGMNTVYDAADNILDSDRKKINNITGVAAIMTRVARKRSNYSNLDKYLKAAIDATTGSSNPRLKKKYDNFVLDRIICIENDTLKAINLKKNQLGVGWEQNPEIYYSFSKWCLERAVNLAEAQMFAERAVKRSGPGKGKAMVLETLADILVALDDDDGAIAILEQAEFEDPNNDKYSRKIEELQGISIDIFK